MLRKASFLFFYGVQMRYDFFKQLVCLFAGAFLFFQAEAAGSVTLQNVGDVQIAIPAPPGFSDPTPVSTELTATAQSMIPSTNRLLAFFVTDEDLKKAASGKEADMDRYFGAQISKKWESTTISSSFFQTIRSEFRAQQQDLLEKSKPAAQKNIDNGFKDENLSLKLGEIRPLGIIHDSDKAITLLAVTKYSGADAGKPFEYLVAMAMTIAHVKGRALYLYTYALHHDKSDLDWVRSASGKWTDLILEMN